MASVVALHNSTAASLLAKMVIYHPCSDENLVLVEKQTRGDPRRSIL